MQRICRKQACLLHQFPHGTQPQAYQHKSAHRDQRGAAQGSCQQGECEPMQQLAVIARAADLQSDIRKIVRMQSYKLVQPNGKTIELSNTNRVLRSASYCDGMKTGYTDAAGYCLVATGERNGRRRIVVVLNDTSTGVWKDAESLLDWALKA